jgi:hypothetical protein
MTLFDTSYLEAVAKGSGHEAELARKELERRKAQMILYRKENKARKNSEKKPENIV